MGIMAVGQIILLSALFVQTLSAPSGCIESCNFYQTSYQNRRTSGGYQDHAGLVQGSTNLNNYDYARPGNWTERNQYITDSGHGKVHEERGQYVEGSKRVRYYKKNFTSSHGTGNVDGELSGQHRYDSLHIPSQHLESQDTQLGQTVTKESGYSSVHSQQSSTRIGGKSERLEDFGEYGHSQHGVNVQTSETTPENWSRVDSYKTDGGHGRVFEEEGQYVSGPKKVRYFKKNYTSSYSTSGDAEHSETLDKLHSELHQNVQQELDKFRREFHHQTANIAGLTQEAAHSFHSNDLQTAESENTYGQQQISGFRRVPSAGTVRHYTDQQQTEAFADRQQSLYPSVNTYGTESQKSYQSHETHVSRAHPVSPSSHLSPSYPVQVTGGNYQSYSHLGGHQVGEIQREISGAHQSGVTQSRLLTEHVYNPNPTPNYNIYPGRRDESRHYQEEHWQSSSSHNAGNLAPEHSADFTLHGTGSRTHYDRDAYNEQRGRYHSTAHGYDSRVGSSYGSGYGTRSGQQLIAAESSLDLGRATHGADCTEETHQQYQHETSYHRKYKRDNHHVQQDQEFEQDPKQLDLTQANNQQSEDFTQHDEDFTQQTESQLEFGQQTVNDQHLNDFTQQNEQFTQQTHGFGFGPQLGVEFTQPESNDRTQQTDKLEFGQQIVGNQHLEDSTQQDKQFTQQTEGQLEFGQQTVNDQHLNDFTQQNEQFTQQTHGFGFGPQLGVEFTQPESNDRTQQIDKLEFGQQIVGNQHLEDSTQQDKQFTQQTEGQLEFGQQTVNDQHLNDFTQQNEQFTQQTHGFGFGPQLGVEFTQPESNDRTQQTDKLEFGQQIVGNQHLEDSTQQDKQFTQQTEGQLEFGQQTVNDQHLNDFTQQNEQFTQQTHGFGFGPQLGVEFTQPESNDRTQQTDKLEFGQQIVGNQHLEDSTQQDKQFTQQTEGQLEFDQQTVNDQHLNDFTQQNEQFTQQTHGFGFGPQLGVEFTQPESNDRTQQTDKLEFGQQIVGNQHLEDLTQQDKQFTQQTEGQLEFGQQSVDDQHLNDFTQQNEQFTQQTQGSDHLTSDEMSKLLSGSQIGVELTQPESNDRTQQTDKFEFGQQTVGNQHIEDLTQQDKQFTQETEGQLEFGQQTLSDQHLTPHNEQVTQSESNDRAQQTDKLEFGQQTVGNQHLEDLTQQDKQFTQETEGQLEFGQQIVGNQHLEDQKQQAEQFETAGSDDFTQQTVGKLEFGQQTDDTQQLTQQIEHFEQRATRSKDLTQQTSGKLEFGQQTADNHHLEDVNIFDKSQSIDKPAHPKNQHLEEFNNEDFSQQTGGHDFTQQTMGQLEFAQQDSNNPKISHHSGDFIQSNKDLNQQVGEFDDFTQQGRFEYGQQRDQSQKPSWPGYNTQHSDHFSQQNDWTTDDLSQQSHQYPSYGNNNNNEQSEWQLDMSQKTQQDFTQQTNDDRQFVKPAPKPKLRQHNSIPSHMDRTDTNLDDIFEPIEVNPEAEIDNLQGKNVQHSSRLTHFTTAHHRSDIPHEQNQGSSVFDNEKENMDRLHWVHKSNDATVGLQWHYTYHPSDLTNIESSHNNYYPHHNVNLQQTEDTQQQQSKPFDFSQQETQNKDTFENIDVFQPSQTQHDKHDQQLGSFQQAETSHFDNQFNQNSETPLKVIPLQNSQQTSMQTTEQTERKIESRILEAYGGGPYASRNDDIYRRVKPNPSATLPPIGGEDPWDIREKPKEIIPWTVADTLPTVSTSNVRAVTTEASEITTQIIEGTTAEAPSFWSRVGHKITRTYDKAKESYDKAKEKAKEYFG